jgi:hypothetical protein
MFFPHRSSMAWQSPARVPRAMAQLQRVELLPEERICEEVAKPSRSASPEKARKKAPEKSHAKECRA